MAYHGAGVASVGTSPIAIGIPGPGPDDAPLLLDMSTSVTAWGRIRQAAAGGERLPEGFAIDAQGKPTTDANQAAAALPLGGPKGSGLALMFECLTGILAGTPIIAALAGGSKPATENAMIAVFNIENFRSAADYRRDIGELKAAVKALPRRDGFGELLLPGERGDREAALRGRSGIPLPEKFWAELGTIARDAGVPALQAL